MAISKLTRADVEFVLSAYHIASNNRDFAAKTPQQKIDTVWGMIESCKKIQKEMDKNKK